jgi:predicted dehydrogenase
MLGMSPGNAHPYSWAAIVNGCFDGEEITRIGYPAVVEYLTLNKSEIGITGARVTHVWCQEKSIAKSIAKSSAIDNVVDKYQEMVGKVDAVIIGRDDPESHVDMARPFVEAGIPIFVDKPLASTMEDLQYFKNSVLAGKFIMSCSSMRYARETNLAIEKIDALGQIHLVVAVGKKDWVKYGVHMLEAVFTVLNDPQPLAVEAAGENNRSIVIVEFANGAMATFHLFMDITSTFQVSIFGENDFMTYAIKDSYSMFRANLEAFIQSVKNGKPDLAFDKTYAIIKTLIAGVNSMETGKKIIF